MPGGHRAKLGRDAIRIFTSRAENLNIGHSKLDEIFRVTLIGKKKYAKHSLNFEPKSISIHGPILVRPIELQQSLETQRS